MRQPSSTSSSSGTTPGDDDTVHLPRHGEVGAAQLAGRARTGRIRSAPEAAGPADARQGPSPAPAYPAPTPPPPAPGSRLAGPPAPVPAPTPPAAATASAGDLLDTVADWPASPTPVGILQMVPVRPARDLRLITAWMNDPAVAAFWELSGPAEVTEAHVRAQVEGDGRSVPCLGVLDGVPMSYWEIYRADLDPLAHHCPVQPHDTGLHLLIGGGPDRGRGVGTALLRAVADLVLDRRPRCARVLAEPDVRNTPSIAAFLGAGFRYCAEVRLPEKQAALMVRDRALRTTL